MDADIVQLVQQRRLMYFEHIMRIDQRRLSYILLYGRMHGTRPRGRPNNTWLDNIRDDCAEMEITTTSATRLAIDRSRWTIAARRLLDRTDPSLSSLHWYIYIYIYIHIYIYIYKKISYALHPKTSYTRQIANYRIHISESWCTNYAAKFVGVITGKPSKYSMNNIVASAA